MPSPEKVFNAGYEITQRIDLGDRQFVVGHSATAPSPYVSWEYFAERDSYYQGHYFLEEADATLDLFRRASEKLNFDDRSLGVALLTDSDRQDLFLEFQNQNAKADIASALSDELEDQEISYDQNALLADPDFMSRAMFFYDRLDHGHENEALRDQIAMILDDYPQYRMMPAEQTAEVRISPEMGALIHDLLTIPTAQIPAKYGPMGDNIQFEFPLEGDMKATFELWPDNYKPKTFPHYGYITLYSANGSPISNIVCDSEDLLKSKENDSYRITIPNTNVTVIIQEDEALRRTGNPFVFTASSEEERYTDHDGEICTIQRALTTKECDILCSGFMWLAEFPNGEQLHVFDYELTPVSQEQNLKASLSQQIQNAKDRAANTPVQENIQQER